jgi:hypothetical protein
VEEFEKLKRPLPKVVAILEHAEEERRATGS